jgi:hypothetical protein
MSIVRGDWETLKRFNLAELYQPVSKSDFGGPRAQVNSGASLETATTDDIQAPLATGPDSLGT